MESSKLNKCLIKFSLEQTNSQMSPAETGPASLHLAQRPLTQLVPQQVYLGWIWHHSQHNIVPQTTLSNSGSIGPPIQSDISQKAFLFFMLL